MRGTLRAGLPDGELRSPGRVDQRHDAPSRRRRRPQDLALGADGHRPRSGDRERPSAGYERASHGRRDPTSMTGNLGEWHQRFRRRRIDARAVLMPNQGRRTERMSRGGRGQGQATCPADDRRIVDRSELGDPACARIHQKSVTRQRGAGY